MAPFLYILGPVAVLGLIAGHLFLVLKRPAVIGKLVRTALSWLQQRMETVEIFIVPAAPRDLPKSWQNCLRLLATTAPGIWVFLTSVLLLYFWIRDWVSPRVPSVYLEHLAAAWLKALGMATLAFGMIWVVSLAWRMCRAEKVCGHTGLVRMWLARTSLGGSRFRRRLERAVAEASRVEVLDFTGYELLAKGSRKDGGPLAWVLARHPHKEARVLLFNPCARDVDPDRKQATVLESQLASLEMTREAFETRLRATLDRIELLNRQRSRPIEVQLYSEKPSFRVLAAGQVAFLGVVGAGDGSGELPLFETVQRNGKGSLQSAARAHFLHVWAGSVPVAIEASSVIQEDEPVLVGARR